jgi:hypothetical protein
MLNDTIFFNLGCDERGEAAGGGEGGDDDDDDDDDDDEDDDDNDDDDNNDDCDGGCGDTERCCATALSPSAMLNAEKSSMSTTPRASAVPATDTNESLRTMPVAPAASCG